MPELPVDADPGPATPIGDMRQWQLHIQCGLCRRHVVLQLSSVAEHSGGRMRIAEVVRRLHCTGYRGQERCRGTPKRVLLVKVSTYGKTTRKLREIVVLDKTRQE
ncbi:MAG TPA: hypothetical protein VGF36_00260 [Rhodopila sp.]